MKITLNSTDTFKTIENKPRRVWKGQTECGVKIEAYIDAILIKDPANADLSEFKRDLKPLNTPD